MASLVKVRAFEEMTSTWAQAMANLAATAVRVGLEVALAVVAVVAALWEAALPEAAQAQAAQAQEAVTVGRAQLKVATQIPSSKPT
mmetsp:Transcript_89411/g.158689  ORF Transcript_89411/g.158689 Transcript_89411/m.158689 type:complete len:86 (+) Transcript_89411:1005-1262(+)